MSECLVFYKIIFVEMPRSEPKKMFAQSPLDLFPTYPEAQCDVGHLKTRFDVFPDRL